MEQRIEVLEAALEKAIKTLAKIEAGGCESSGQTCDRYCEYAANDVLPELKAALDGKE